MYTYILWFIKGLFKIIYRIQLITQFAISFFFFKMDFHFESCQSRG